MREREKERERDNSADIALLERYILYNKKYYRILRIMYPWKCYVLAIIELESETNVVWLAKKLPYGFIY